MRSGLSIPDSLDPLLNHSSRRILLPFYQFCHTRQFPNLTAATFEDLKILKDLSRGTSRMWMSRIFRPCYRNIIYSLTTFEHTNDSNKPGFGDLYELFRIMQYFIFSYYTFELELIPASKIQDSNLHYFVESLCLNFFERTLSPIQNSTDVEQRLKERWGDTNRSHATANRPLTNDSIKLACEAQHFETIGHIINQRLRLASNSPHIEEIGAILKLLEQILTLLESLIRVLLSNHDISTVPKLRNAYAKIFTRRSRSITLKYTNKILAVSQGKGRNLAQASVSEFIRRLFGLFDQIEWNLIIKYHGGTPADVDAGFLSFDTSRVFVQSALLVLNDVDLISDFRLIRWPEPLRNPGDQNPNIPM